MNQQIPPYPCTVVNEVDRPKGVVPHYLPGTNNDITWFSRRYGIPMDVVNAGAANMYPEIRAKIPRSMGGFGPEPPPTPASQPRTHVRRRAPASSRAVRDETNVNSEGCAGYCRRDADATRSVSRQRLRLPAW